MSQKKFVHVVRVPSIEHAAEVIGHMGSKINTLQEKTKSLIITPNPGSAPIFIIKAPTVAAMLECKSTILQSCAHFDNVRLQKRNIIMPRQSVVSTLRLFNNQIKIIIGKDGIVIQTIENLFNVFIKSPDRSTTIAYKEPIFVISGQQQDVNNCITFIKLLLFHCNHYVRLTLMEFQSIETLLTNHLNSIINLQSIKRDLVLQKMSLKAMRLTVVETKSPNKYCSKFYCPLCFSYNIKKAKAFPCEHFVCCQHCIVPLYRHPDAQCTKCPKKIDQFEIFNYWIF
ncbi:unnamed protein product [Diamesa serratosioi]